MLILGSSSPRRKEILGFFSLAFTVETSNFDESSILFTGDPTQYVLELAKAKLTSLKDKFRKEPILTADTVVFCNGKVYNKPANAKQAFQALTELQGKWHSVFTGLALSWGNHIYEEFEETRVLFNPLTEDEIRHYNKKIHFADKAGGYAIQMGGGLIVNKIDGCYYNVMGMPVNTLRKLLKHADIELWDYVK